MNIYHNLNEAISYIENNLFEEIDMQKAGSFIGTNATMFNNFLSVLTGYTVKQYIKYRRLSECTKMLPNYKIVDLAVLCGYDNRSSFSRAFKEFHGINPSEVNEKTDFKYFNRLYFDEENTLLSNIEIKYKELDKLTLYGEYRDILSNDDFEKFWDYILEKYPSVKMAKETFGLVFLNKDRNIRYYIALRERFDDDNEVIKLPKAKVIFTTKSKFEGKTIRTLGKSMKSKSIYGFPDIEIYREDSVELIYKI